MLKLYGNLPEKCIIATSGGIDSMVLYHFLSNSNRDIKCVFFNHNTETSKNALDFLKRTVKHELIVGNISSSYSSNKEASWRVERYKFFNEVLDNTEGSILLGHHLNDVVETYIHSMMNGVPKFINYKYNDRIIRPFISTTKESIRQYAERNSVDYIEDESNTDLRYTRNRIRHMIIPEMLKCNPGLFKVYERKLLKYLKGSGSPT
jgi:tRNA(Ile)-lysidine synthase